MNFENQLMVRTFTDVLNEKEVAYLLSRISEAPAGSTYDCFDKASLYTRVSVEPRNNPIVKGILDKVRNKLEDYFFDMMISAGELKCLQGTSMTVFSIKDDFVPLHSDVPMDNRKKVYPVTCLGYLNDNFEGGDIWFPIQDITVTPKVGNLLVFPNIYATKHTVFHTTGTRIMYKAYFFVDESIPNPFAGSYDQPNKNI